ncbi:PREDICTED: nucleolar complex protein 3 homolog [Priapulus caudatus]|uniref:Nucleolar complex protein 3 homolog n=1 Tax=Priapulus caudatus TaxID=37621 RepID=A0ABM1DNL9_PRICU|nr:PREDICTED: nucleolar complex protein 3 homolog [Priapulus caudatus]
MPYLITCELRPKKAKSVKSGKKSKVSIVKKVNKRVTKLQKQGKLKKLNKKQKSSNVTKGQKVSEGINDLKLPTNHIPNGQSPNESDEDLDREEQADVRTEEGDWSFLLQSLETRKKRKWNDIEDAPRQFAGMEPHAQVKHLLPIKSRKHGIIHQSVDIQQEPDPVPAEEQEKPIVKPVKLPVLSTVQLYADRQRKLAAKKLSIGNLASSIIEDPEENVGKLKQLRMTLYEQDPNIMVTVKKWAMMSLLEVFKDITPGYRIRLSTHDADDGEDSEKLKKETKVLREFEQSLGKNYKLYLEELERMTKGIQKSSKDSKNLKEQLPKTTRHGLAVIAVKCLCSLLTALPHFNYRLNIITVLIPFMAHKSREISDEVCNAVKKLFKEDKLGEASMEATQAIGKLIKTRSYILPAKVLDAFLSLNIKNVNLSAQAEAQTKKEKLMTKKEKMLKMSKRERKRNKQMETLNKELLEAEAEESKAKKTKFQTGTIKAVFLIYFRILKKARKSILLSSVLEGLSKYAHLINVEFFDDLISVLHQLVESGDLNHRQMLHCIQTVFNILSGQGESLNIDPLRFYTDIYNILFKLRAGTTSNDAPLALKCMEMMIIKRRKQVSFHRVVAFIKRLCILSLQLEHNSTIAVLIIVRALLQLFPKSDVLLDSDNQGSGIYLPDLPEPEYCNAHNSALWELHHLSRHHHPAVRKLSHHICQGAPLQGPAQLPMELSRKTYMELFEEFNPDEMNFSPSIPLPGPRRPVSSKSKKVRSKRSGSGFHSEYMRNKVELTLTSVEGDSNVNFAL